MATLYADESGTHSGAEYCVVGGCLGDDPQWNLLSRRWDEVLHAHGVAEFHATDLFGRRVAPYRGWTSQRTTTFLRRLVACTADTGVVPVGSVVSRLDFTSRTPAERQFFTSGKVRLPSGRFVSSGAPSRAYNLLLYDCLNRARRMVRSTLDCILDNQPKYEALAIDIFNALKSKDPYPVGDFGFISFADSACTPPLQLADLVCYLVSSCLAGC